MSADRIVNRTQYPERATELAYGWQSPGALGHVIASFASGWPTVDLDELLDDVRRSRNDLPDDYPHRDELTELEDLLTNGRQSDDAVAR